MYETFDHTADLGLRAWAVNFESLVAETGVGLLSMLVADVNSVSPAEQFDFKIEGESDDYLLFDFLTEILYVFESEAKLFARFDVRRTSTGLQVRAWGEKVDRARHDLEHEVKAITYHGLKIEQNTDGWRAELIVDI